jgi:large subunit ribosomal protein L24
MPTKADIKRLSKPIKLKIRQGDTVMIISGKDRGEVGRVYAVSPKEQKVIVLKENPENPQQPVPLNAAIKHRKAKMQGERSSKLLIPVPIHISNVMVVDPETKQPTRVGRKIVDGKSIRFSKKTGKEIPTTPIAVGEE